MHFSIGFVAEYVPAPQMEDVCAFACDVEEVDCIWPEADGVCK